MIFSHENSPQLDLVPDKTMQQILKLFINEFRGISRHLQLSRRRLTVSNLAKYHSSATKKERKLKIFPNVIDGSIYSWDLRSCSTKREKHTRNSNFPPSRHSWTSPSSPNSLILALCAWLPSSLCKQSTEGFSKWVNECDVVFSFDRKTLFELIRKIYACCLNMKRSEVKLNPKIWGKFYRYLLFALSVSFQLWHICLFCVCRWCADRSFILFEKGFNSEHWTGAKIDAEPIADGIWMFIGRTAWSLPLLIFSWISIFIPIAAALNVLFMVELLAPFQEV